MTKEILEKLHAAHQGTEKMKLRARSAVFWNGINKDIDQTVSHCTECQEAQPRQTGEELEPTDIPPYAWHTVGADLFFLNNADYPIVILEISIRLQGTLHGKPYRQSLPKSLLSEQGFPVILRLDEPLTPSDVPPCAWHTVGVDLFSLNSADYIVIADYYSKYPFSYKLHSTESNAVIRILKTLFAEQGSPAVVRSDNGPQFTSHQFKQFAHEYNFKHVTSSPHHPQSNGFIESQVKIVKHALAKAAKSGLDAGLALLCVRSTPVDNKSKSPAELLFGRQLQDNLPRRFVLWSPSLTVVVARQQYGRRHSLAQESRTRSSSLEHRSLITAFACRSLLSLEDESVLESDHTVVSECLESNNNEEFL